MLLTNTQVSKLWKAFADNSSANIKLSKIQLHKIRKSGGFLGRYLGPLLKTRLLSMGNALKPLAKSVLIPLELTAAADAVILMKIFGSGFTTWIIFIEEMQDIQKIVKSFEDSRVLKKGFSKELKMKQRNKKRISRNAIWHFKA